MMRLSSVLHWVFILLLGLIGLLLTLGGGFLIYLGGSPYYLLAGIATIAVGVLVFRRSDKAPKFFAAILGVTLIWSIFEAELHFLGLLPRLAMWLGLGIWFLTPWYRQTLRIPASDEGQDTSKQPANRWWVGGASLASIAVLLLASMQDYVRNGEGTIRSGDAVAASDDWRHYGNTEGGTRFATVEDINADTVSGLREVWRYRTGVEEDFKATPLNIDGRLYLCTARNVMIAIDDATGEEIWRYDHGIQPPMENQYARTCRGVGYHEAPDGYAGQCAKRVVTSTVDATILAVDADTGELCTDFGENGVVDLWKGMGDNHERFEYWVTSSPLVAGDNLVVGGQVADTQNLGHPSGVVRAFNAMTGKLSWAWDLGNPDNNGFPSEGETYTPGTPNVWSIMSYDAELGLIYAPTGNPPPDYFGGIRRKFEEEYSSAVVAIDAATGKERWKYQTVHNDVWDYDVPAQPVLVDVRLKDELVPSVAVPTKMGDIFLLDRRDGTPVHPIPEVPVPQGSDVPGEKLSPTQPDSPLPDFHPYRYEKDMWGLTPIDQMACRIEYRTMNYEGMYTPPSMVTGITQTGTMLYPGNFGGFNWGSVSVDADNGLLVAAPMMLAHRLSMVTKEQVAEAGPIAQFVLGPNHPNVRYTDDAPIPELGDPDPNDPYDFRRISAYGYPQPFMSRLGTHVPCFEPPWSQIAVIDLNTKELLWSRPAGDMSQSGPFNIRSGIPYEVGTAVRAGTLTTRGGLTFLSSTMDEKVRAYDLRTGEVKWESKLPGNGLATPMTYRSRQNGKQYLIVTVPNPTWRYPRDPATNQYIDSQAVVDGKGGYVIAYALED
ncbi:glucose/quinate/shikimate family membrane-bound PQQ-dependent dehydrogenase [Parasphingorhabdus litoris]|uniref:Glucose/quinate/shikimate family membrane-bound PQQ-dependent dehydrogenase n=1 Tax=Parasphingorhabdus litoris TaxID=394733 RepID=A0ABP3JVS7_9SPHN|nr:PQQ-binding-like beta-propeller repeat protein [Parasphingorhabdus litoris]